MDYLLKLELLLMTSFTGTFSGTRYYEHGVQYNIHYLLVTNIYYSYWAEVLFKIKISHIHFNLTKHL